MKKKVMVDFAGDTMSYVDKSTPEIRDYPVLFAVLPLAIIALPNATIPFVIRALNNALSFLVVYLPV